VLACLVPLVCVITFGAGAVKGRLDRDQGVRVHVEMDNGATDGLMVASLERGILLCDNRCDRGAGPLRLYTWDLIKRVDISSASGTVPPATPAAAAPAPPEAPGASPRAASPTPDAPQETGAAAEPAP
jgi:hypothetical protein